MAPPTLVAPALTRPRLDEWLTEGMRGSVVLVLGEPASGKTTLLLQWLASGVVDDHSVAWLTVPPGISDEVLFWRYLLRAVEPLGLPVDDLRAALLDREPPGDGWLTTLANRLAECPKPPLIVIDDLHELGSDAAFESLADVIERRPAGVSFVFGTQVSPPWPLTRWRMSGLLTEIGSDELRMTADEVRELVRSVGGIELSDAEIGVLVQRTEGWVGGVKLALLSMRKTSDAAEFISRFAADDELISSYLFRDVLGRQDRELRDFLLDASVLETLSADLCDAVRDADDSAELLERCRAGNLFITGVDTRAHRYRLHALFRDLLRATLETSDPDRSAELHRRASTVYEQRGDIWSAVVHALDTPDDRRAGELAQRYAGQFAHRGQFEELQSWARVLRDRASMIEPSALVGVASALCMSGDFDEASRLVDELLTTDMPEGQRLAAEMIRTASSMGRGDVHVLRDRGRRLTALAHSRPAEAVAGTAGNGLFLEAIGAFFEGDLAAARELIELADRPPDRPGPPAYIAVPGWAALIAREQGDLQAAKTFAMRSFDRRAELSSGETAVVAPAFLGLAEVAWEHDDLDVCRQQLERARRSVRPLLWEAVLVARCSSRLTASRGDAEGAVAELVEAGKVYLGGDASPALRALVAARVVELHLTIGDGDAALAWARAHDGCGVGELPWAARIRLADLVEGGDARQLAAEALRSVEPLPRRIDTLLVTAALELSSGDRDSARQHVADALSLGETERFVRRFLECDDEVAALIAELSADPLLIPDATFSPFFTAELLAARRSPGIVQRNGAPPVSEELVEQLSAREVDVLRLLADGLSYGDIGSELFVSRNTVKSHVRHVYTKLGVASRAEAVATGRRLGLV